MYCYSRIGSIERNLRVASAALKIAASGGEEFQCVNVAFQRPGTVPSKIEQGPTHSICIKLTWNFIKNSHIQSLTQSPQCPEPGDSGYEIVQYTSWKFGTIYSVAVNSSSYRNGDLAQFLLFVYITCRSQNFTTARSMKVVPLQ